MNLWKIQRDPYYGDIYNKTSSFDQVNEAGFFEDSSTINKSITEPWFMCSPVGKIVRNLASNPINPAVLLTTGAFCPIHTGHLAAMEVAKRCAESNGYNIVGGYISPGHDEYIDTKVGPDVLNAEQRIALCEESVKGSDWLMVDRWEALVAGCAVNFTDVIIHLKRYLEYHVNQDITIIYVCGSDNARLALTFQSMEHCIVVGRPGYGVCYEQYRNDPRLATNRIMWTMSDVGASSTDVRHGELSSIPSSIVDMYRKMKEPESQAKIVLRDEGEWAVAHFPKRPFRYPRFKHLLSMAITDCFKKCDVSVNQVRQQQLIALIKTQDKQSISLDPCIPMEFNLKLSRCFDVSDSVRTGMMNRPGSPSIANQIDSIPSGEYILFDDDVATGQTMKDVTTMLPERITVKRIEHLATKTEQVTDIADCRDFLIGSREGGLVVRLPDGKIVRAPYCFPYVDVSRRVSISPGKALAFSKSVWQLNAQFYHQTGLTVACMPESTKELLTYVGFNETDLMESVCQSHIDNIVNV